MLDIPCLNNVTKIDVNDEKLLVERTLEDSVEIFELDKPALLSVSSEINTPSVPAMKDIMKAGKKPVKEMVQEENSNNYIEVLSEKAPEKTERQQLIFEEASDEAIDKIVSYIKSEAL